MSKIRIKSFSYLKVSIIICTSIEINVHEQWTYNLGLKVQ